MSRRMVCTRYYTAAAVDYETIIAAVLAVRHKKFKFGSRLEYNIYIIYPRT